MKNIYKRDFYEITNKAEFKKTRLLQQEIKEQIFYDDGLILI